MDAGPSDDAPDLPVAAATPPMRTPRSQKTPIQKEALVRQLASSLLFFKLAILGFVHVRLIAMSNLRAVTVYRRLPSRVRRFNHDHCSGSTFLMSFDT